MAHDQASKAQRPGPSQAHNNTHPSRRNHIQKPAPPKWKKVNAVKTRLRDLRRLLRKKADSMPANQQVALEREQQDLELELEEAVVEQQRKPKKDDDMIGRYHMVRFFERKQAAKLLKRAQRNVSAPDPALPPPARDDQVAESHRREVDLMYTQYFPLSQPYSSLYAKNAERQDADPDPKAAPKRDHPMWEVVEEAMASGTLQELRDRVAPVEQQPVQPQVERREIGSQTKKKSRNLTGPQSPADVEARMDVEGESDGGGNNFFEAVST